MNKFAWLLLILFAVPAVGYAAASGVEAHLDSELRDAIRSRYPQATYDQVQGTTVQRLCESDRSNISEVCDTSDAMDLMQRAAVTVVVASVALLCVIAVAGRAAQTHRAILAYTFRPGLYITMALLVAIVIVHAGLAIGTVYFGESALVNRVHGGIILVIGIGAALGVLAMARASLTLVKKAQVIVVGQVVTNTQAPKLWDLVTRAAQRMGALQPNQIVLGLEPNFFVTEADVLALSGKLQGRTLYLSLPLTRILTIPELESIIGHELGHFKGADTKYSEKFYPVYRGTASALQGLHELANDGAKAIALLPAIATLGYFYESFATAENKLSRDREFVADTEGARLTDAATLGIALVKAHAFSGLWAGFDEAAANALRRGQMFTNASALFAEVVAKNAVPAALHGLADRVLPHPTDSHPPLAARLSALSVSLDAIGERALEVQPPDGAASLVPSLEQTEELLSDAHQQLLVKKLRISVPDAA